MSGLRILLLTLVLAAIPVAGANIDVARFNTEQESARYQKLIAELRCLVCQNQNLADSNADLATDLKNIVRQKILAGETNAQILDFMTQRYGDFVLYRPPLKSSTVLLWIGPALFILAGLIIVLAYIRRTRAAPATVTQRELARARELLETKDPE